MEKVRSRLERTHPELITAEEIVELRLVALQCARMAERLCLEVERLQAAPEPLPSVPGPELGASGNASILAVFISLLVVIFALLMTK